MFDSSTTGGAASEERREANPTATASEAATQPHLHPKYRGAAAGTTGASPAGTAGVGARGGGHEARGQDEDDLGEW